MGGGAMKKTILGAAAAILCAVNPLHMAAIAATAQTASAAVQFGARENVEYIDISPDGHHVVYLQAGPGRATYVFLADLDQGGESRLVVRSDGNPERLRWCNFVTNDRLICQMSAVDFSGIVALPFTRLISIDTTGQNLKLLGQQSSFYDSRVRQFDGEIVDWSGGEDGTVLMSRSYVPEAGRTGSHISRTSDGIGVDRIDVRTLRATRVEAPNPTASFYMSDGRGVVRVMATRAMRGATGQLGATVDFRYRADGSERWQTLGSWDTRTGAGLYPLAVDRDLDAVYVLQKLNGRLALYRIKLDGSMASELVYANEHVDVDDVVRSSRGLRVIGVTFAEAERRTVYFDQDYAALARNLGHAIPNLPLIDFGSASADGNRILVHAGSDSDPGRYYVYDRATRQLNEIMLARPELENVALSQVRSISYPAADGSQIPGYLTLPPGREDARGLPAVILPHGGPSARDEWGFDWLAQYLAHQGYAVLQANYRGSAGYGDDWLRQNGFQGWRTSIGDITAGARWLAQQGIADPNRLAILGWSYGGYAALQAGATEPGLFKAIVAIAPVTDLQQAKDDVADYTDARNVAEFIGSGSHVVEGSPLRHADAIVAPVLLFHGDHDLNVRVIHSQRMDAALRAAGHQSELTVFPGLEHDLADSTARAQMLGRIGAFLDANLHRQ